jgi:tRNA-binding protein
MTIAEGFFATDIRLGTIVEALPFPEARKPSIKVAIDFGPEIGLKWSSAQITTYYSPDSLVGRQIIAAMNLGPKRIAGFVSEVLVLGVMASSTDVILLSPDRPAANGSRIA